MGFEFADSNEGVVNIKVIGCGGGGCNAVNRMIRAGVQGVDFVVINTDKPVLDNSSAPIKLQIGEKLTKGKGAGSDPNVGENSALESREEIEAEVVQLIEQGGKTGYILGADCSIHDELPEEKIRWVVEAARRI